MPAKTETKSALLIKKDQVAERLEKTPQYQTFSQEEQEYSQALWARLINARDQHLEPHIELDDMTVGQYVERNEMRANTYIPPRKNKGDVTVTSGLAREKGLAVAANIHRLNLKPEVHSYDKNKDEDTRLSRSFTSALRKSRDLENDAEKRLLRIWTMLKHGTIAVEEAWVPSVKIKKKIKDRSKLDPATGFAGLEWIEKFITTYRAESAIISMKNVLLGNIRQFDFEKQPFAATVEYRDYDEVAPIFRNWKNWDLVKAGLQSFSQLQMNDGTLYGDMTLFERQENKLEIIKYQDWINDEYQIIINGVLMLPMGFPCPWEWEGPSISWQVFEPITENFAYGKSLMAKIDRDDELITMMLRLFMRKTLQSTNPPVGNMTRHKLPQGIFDPGRVWNGINASQINKLIDHAGVNSNEWAMFEKVREFIDSKSISRIAQGQQLSRSATATEILELQRQAQISIGLALAAYTMLEWKMANKRLGNILTNWTKAEEETWDDTKQVMVKRYKTIEIANSNFGDKHGVEKITFTDKVYDFKEKQALSRQMFHDEETHNNKSRTTIISIPMLRSLKYTHHITITPSEEESDNLNKILFGEEFTQAAQFFGPQSINLDFYKRKFAKVWGNNPMDMFSGFGVDQLSALAEQAQGVEPEQSALPGQQGNPNPQNIKKSGGPMANAMPDAGQAAGMQEIGKMMERNEKKAQGAVMNR